MIQINKLQKIVGAVIITALVVAGVMYVWHASLTRAAEQKLHKSKVVMGSNLYILHSNWHTKKIKIACSM
jgi:hypothetical protein